MKLFHCPRCGTLAAFENPTCICGARIGYDDRTCAMAETSVRCANAVSIGCNWIPDLDGTLCRACAMTTVTPDTETADNRFLWAEAERAKRRVLNGLGQWGWFTREDPGPPPEFHLLSEVGATGTTDVMMGHMGGVITINVSEADVAVRVYRREMLGERFRTVVGHMRHELAHFLHRRLLEEQPEFITQFRALFGDERADYAAALRRHYDDGPVEGWGARHITPYAAAHPHEDWAETAAHIQHITDIVDSFVAAGLSSPSLTGTTFQAYAEPVGMRLINLGVEIGISLNHVNRSMGLPDLYPFILTPAIREKLDFAHRWLRCQQGPAHTGTGPVPA